MRIAVGRNTQVMSSVYWPQQYAALRSERGWRAAGWPARASQGPTKRTGSALDRLEMSDRPVNEQKYQIGPLDGRRMRIDVLGYLLSNGLRTKVHYGRYQATNKQRTITVTGMCPKAVCNCNFLWEILSLLKRESRIRRANRDYISISNRDLDPR